MTRKVLNTAENAGGIHMIPRNLSTFIYDIYIREMTKSVLPVMNIDILRVYSNATGDSCA